MPYPQLVQENVLLKSRFWNGPVDIYVTGYPADPTQPAILATLTETEEPAFKASVMVEGGSLEDGEVFIKGWGENEGIPDAMVKAGLITGPKRSVTLRYVTHEAHVGIYELSEKMLQVWHEFQQKRDSEEAETEGDLSWL